MAELVQRARMSFYLEKVVLMKKEMGVYYKRKCGLGQKSVIRKRRETERRRKGHELIWENVNPFFKFFNFFCF